VLDVGGIGYEIFIPLSSYDSLPPENETCRLLTCDYVREDQHALYGFMTEAERSMFNMLMTISGIGPKLALSALSGLSVRELNSAILNRDVGRLNCISGVGRKTAERIVVELRDRITAGEAAEAEAGAAPLSQSDIIARDAILALISLGYKQAQADKIVRKVLSTEPTLENVEDIIRKALAQ
jgi:Holliday junction DNA helicase RuvA